MSSLHAVVMDAMPNVRKVIGRVRPWDSELAEEMERCFTRLALDHALGSATRGKLRVRSLESALGAAARLQAAYDLAQGWGYLKNLDDVLSDPLRQAVRTLGGMAAMARTSAELEDEMAGVDEQAVASVRALDESKPS